MEKSMTGYVQLLMKTNEEFLKELKQRLILESNNVRNPYKFIAGLFTEGVLCDGSSEPEAVFGLREMIVQHAMMIAFSKGAESIGGLMKALEGSGNSQLISVLSTWAKEDFGIETGGSDGDLKHRRCDFQCSFSEPKQVTSIVQSTATKNLPKNVASPANLSSSGTELIDGIMAHLEDDFMEKLEGHWVGKAPEIVNTTKFVACLHHENVLKEADIHLTTTTKAQCRQHIEKVIKAACSKRAIGSLVLAFERSNNKNILTETCEWLEASKVRKKNYPISVKSLTNQGRQEDSKVAKSTFFEQAALADGLSKLATFNCPERSIFWFFQKTNGTSFVQFDKERMMACAADGTLNLWNWRVNEEEPNKLVFNVKNITCFQYDDEILVLGTAKGSVHLFDATTFEEKWTVRLGEPITLLKFVESTLAVITQTGDHKQLWWLDIMRPDMRLLDQRSLGSWQSCENQFAGICMYPDTTFVNYCSQVYVYDTKSGKLKLDDRKYTCYLSSPANISTLSAGDLISTNKVVAAGCNKGTIAMWNTTKFLEDQSPVKILLGHTKAVVSLCFVNGHLLSLDNKGKLLMWSGYDLGNKNITPVPRRLVGSYNCTNLAAHERWFASCSSKDDKIHIWTLPDLWLRTG